MYKRTSRAMKHAQRVDTIHPSKGFIYGQAPQPDVLQEIEAMPRAELEAEKERLLLENRRWHADMAAAKTCGDAGRAARIGAVQQTIQARLSSINAALKRMNISDRSARLEVFKNLVKEEIGLERVIALQDKADRIVDEQGGAA